MQSGDAAAAISRAALSGDDALASRALDLWIAVYGAETSNLGLKIMSTGGLFLTGGISPKILPRLEAPVFMEAFLDKGRMRPLVEAMPVHVVTNEKAGLLGAARCAAVRGFRG
jgi:glucokinase